MEPMDCKDIKALLSPLVDGIVDEDKRHNVERHLADCRPCRDMLDEAERLHKLVALDMESREGDSLPSGFCDGVFARTVRADAQAATYGRRWTTWTGWFAAAAAMALAATIWIMDRQVAQTDEVDPDQRMSVAYNSNPFYSTIDPDAVIADRLVGAPSARLVSTISRPVGYEPGGGLGAAFGGTRGAAEPQRELNAGDVARGAILYDALVIVQGVSQANMDSWRDIEQIRRMVEYDRTLERLEQADVPLSPDERRLVDRIRQQMQHILEGRIDEQYILDLQQEYRDYGVLRKLQDKYDASGLSNPV